MALTAILVVAMMLCISVIPAAQDSDAETEYWTYTVTPTGKVTDSDGNVLNPAGIHDETTGTWGSRADGRVGDWGFDDAGCGPFGSFYAAFDACHGNKMICHLDPDDLKQSVDGTISFDETRDDCQYGDHTVNIMWCLPTIYWSVDSDGNLVLSNDPSKGTAYAHTIDGEPYEYLGIGVYEASKGDDHVLTSTSGTGSIAVSRSTMRDLATSQTVATGDGENSNGHAMLWNVYMWQLYRFSVLAVGGGWNSQGIFGNGDTFGQGWNSRQTTGTLDGSGPYAGTVGNYNGSGDADSYHQSHVKAFIEDAWGLHFDTVDGVLIYYEDGEVRMYATQSSEPTDSAADYTTMIGVLPSNSVYGGTVAISTSAANPEFWGLPTASTGSESVDFYDFCRSKQSSTSASPCGLLTGGCSFAVQTASYECGISAIDAYDGTNYNYAAGGGRLAFVFNDDPASTITYDHRDLISLGVSESAVSALPKGIRIAGGDDTYTDLGNVEGFKHVGWEVDGATYGCTHDIVSFTAHTAVSLWEAQDVTYDHSGLKEKLISIGGSESEMSGLPSGIGIPGNPGYGQLPDVGEFTHTGWLIDGVEYPATHAFVSLDSHTAVSVWMGLPAVTYDHSRLIEATGDESSVAGLPTGMEMTGKTNYEKLPDRGGYSHVGWEVDGIEVGPSGPFVTKRTHTAKSLWEEHGTPVLQAIVFYHTNLTDIVGTDAQGVSDLQGGISIDGNTNYPQLPDTAGYRHTGWEVDGCIVGPTAGFVQQTEHVANSIWTKIVDFVPIFPDIDGTTDGEHPLAIVPDTGKEPWLGKNGRTILIIAILSAIIGELAVLALSRRH